MEPRIRWIKLQQLSACEQFLVSCYRRQAHDYAAFDVLPLVWSMIQVCWNRMANVKETHHSKGIFLKKEHVLIATYWSCLSQHQKSFVD